LRLSFAIALDSPFLFGNTICNRLDFGRLTTLTALSLLCQEQLSEMDADTPKHSTITQPSPFLQIPLQDEGVETVEDDLDAYQYSTIIPTENFAMYMMILV
jgi:hypothetical protein